MPNIKRINQINLFGYVTAMAFLCWISHGCINRTEGCLDTNAENFDLSAERACNGCCTYPSIGLTLTQKWNDRNYSNVDTLLDINNQPYLIHDLKYFFSSWTWQDSDGVVYTTDSITANCNGENLSFTPDMVIIDTRQFIYSLGTIRQSPLVTSISGILGLVEDFSCLSVVDSKIPAALSDQSPLWNHQIDGLETLRLVLQRNLGEETLDTLFFSLQMNFGFDYHEQIVKGFDTKLFLSVNYAQWFQQADISDLSSFRNSMEANFMGSITRTP